MAIQMNSDPGPVAGYAWPQSVVPGESFDLHLTNRLDQRQVMVEVARIGLRREVVWSERLEVGDYPYPDGFTSNGCDWPVAVTVTASEDWRSGYYEILLTGDEGPASRAFVVVRAAPGKEADILLALSTNTWNAYNDVHNGSCLYTDARVAAFTRPMSPGFLHKTESVHMRSIPPVVPDPLRLGVIGYKASNAYSDWCSAAGWAAYELPFSVWAEGEGYQIDYAINADLERGEELLAPYRLLLSVGHDEYWSGPMRDAVESYTDAGGNVAFLTGNTAFWQVRIERSGTTMVGYKYDFEHDPVYGTDRQNEVTSIWSDSVVGRPENHLTGVSFCRGGYCRISSCVPEGSGGYTVHRPHHWLLDGTGLRYGDLLGAESIAVGYECDGCELAYRDGLPYPTGADGTPLDFEIVATSPVVPTDRESVPRPLAEDQLSELEFIAWRMLGDMKPETQARIAHGHCVMGCFTRGEGTVVTVSSTEWARALTGRSPRVEQVTRNIFKMLAGISARD